MFLFILHYFSIYSFRYQGFGAEGSTTPPLELMPPIDESGFTTSTNTDATVELKPPENSPDVSHYFEFNLKQGFYGRCYFIA